MKAPDVYPVVVPKKGMTAWEPVPLKGEESEGNPFDRYGIASPVLDDLVKLAKEQGEYQIYRFDNGVPTALSWNEDSLKEPMEDYVYPDAAVSAYSRQEGGSHYKDMVIQPVEFIMANKLGFCEGNTIKYVCRYKVKGGIEDLKKARHYIDMLIEQESKGE